MSDRLGLPTPTPQQTPEGVDLRASSVEVQSAPAFPNVPLVALGRTVFPPPNIAPPAAVQAWQERQVAQSQLSCRGEYVEAADARHFIHRDRPDLVIAAIERVVDAAHPKRPQVAPQGASLARGTSGGRP